MSHTGLTWVLLAGAQRMLRMWPTCAIQPVLLDEGAILDVMKYVWWTQITLTHAVE